MSTPAEPPIDAHLSPRAEGLRPPSMDLAERLAPAIVPAAHGPAVRGAALPVPRRRGIGPTLLSLFTFLVIILAIRAVQVTPALTWVSIGLGIPVAIFTVLEASDPSNGPVSLVSGILHAAFYFYVAYAFLRYMLHDRVVTLDEFFAVGAVFTVLAWAFAYVFSATQVIWPASFTSALVPHGPQAWFDLLFLSFTTLTSVGLSDIVPILPNARSVVMVEEVVGLLYVALVISRIVGLNLRRQT